MAINYLEKSGILEIETSREEAPSKEYPKQKLKREVLRHRISPKMRFTAPFLRFWFYFVAPHAHQIEEGNYDGVLQRFTERYHSYTSLVFEELSNLFLIHLNQKDIIIDYGSYWDRQVEIDILAHTYNGRTIVGECKWTNHKINKKELTKLLEKCERTDIKADVIALFSKRGFSNELLSLKNEQLQLYSADDFERLVSNLTQDDLIKGFSRP
jgi:AAA+ ATPase superfamily predicted ATPase